ncbi:MAG: ChaN family lipoprotein [Pirellula sp.]|nr:ChaN family lipoprotein [Pirellula sp.]
MKMKSLIALLVLSVNGMANARSEEPAFPASIVRVQDGTEVALADFATEAARVDVLVLGEEHDSDGAHQMQHDIIRELIQSGYNVAISMEMFERDCQGALNEYLAGRIDEPTFLSKSRPWKNYAAHYRSIIELAKQHRLPVIASNTPRDIASKVSKGESIESTLAPFHARKTTADKDLYWENFVNAMKGHGGMEESDAGRLFFEAQCLKDDTMAESITDFLASHAHRPVLVVHLCGKFHSDYGLGTVSRIQSRNRLARVIVMSTERLDAKDDFKINEVKGRAHYMMVVPQNVEKKPEPAKDEPAVAPEASGDSSDAASAK